MAHDALLHLTAEVQLGNRPIAVVDDDPLVRRALERILDAMDYSVEPFGSAEDFLACEARDHYGCLVLDVQMAGLSGLDLYAQLAAEGREIPIVFISASRDAVKSVENAAGPNSLVLLKPLDAEHLRDAINKKMSASAIR